MSCITRTFRSRALLKEMRLHIYLPPGYAAAQRYPIVYLLHPWGADETYWAAQLAFDEVANRLITGGALPPFIAVMPQGDKSYFLNAADPHRDFSFIIQRDPTHFAGAIEGCGDYGDYILQDVPAYIEKAFNVRQQGRVIAGVGMGATGAAVLAFRHPEAFGAVAVHSPVLFAEAGFGPPWLFGLNDARAFAQRDPLVLARHLTPHGGLRIYIDSGLDDEYSPLSADLHRRLAERDIPHIYESRPGQHGDAYWRAHLAEYLGFYAAGW